MSLTPKARAAFFATLRKNGRLNPTQDKVQMPKVHMLTQAPNPMDSYDKLNTQDVNTTPKPTSTNGLRFKKLKKLWA